MKVEGGGRRLILTVSVRSYCICVAQVENVKGNSGLYLYLYFRWENFCKVIDVTFDLIVVVYQFLIIHSFLSNDYNFVLDTFVKKYNKIVIEIVVKKLCTYECTISKRILKYNGFARST